MEIVAMVLSRDEKAAGQGSDAAAGGEGRLRWMECPCGHEVRTDRPGEVICVCLAPMREVKNPADGEKGTS